jgi:hypothetical protein
MEGSPFDKWETPDVYSAMEAALMETQGALDEYRRVSTSDDKAKVLAVVHIKMNTAMEALGVLRKRYG